MMPVNKQHSLDACYYELDTMVSDLYMISFICTEILEGRSCHYSRCTDEETEALSGQAFCLRSHSTLEVEPRCPSQTKEYAELEAR